MTAEAAHIARRAAEIAQERGHCKGMFNGDDGTVCMWGALFAAKNELLSEQHMIPLAVYAALYDLKLDDRTASCFPGAGWNDEPDTDERDVAKVLLQVADRLEVAP